LDELERRRDPKILEKSTFTVTNGSLEYGTEDESTWVRRSKEYRHVVHTDRTKIPDMPKIKGTITFHEAAGECNPSADNQGKWKLRMSGMPCAVLVLSWQDHRALKIHAYTTSGSTLGL
jgi:hypothetical protein